MNNEKENRWADADSDGTIHVPDYLDPLVNKIGMQIRFHTISGKNEIQTVCDMTYAAEKFFQELNAATEARIAELEAALKEATEWIPCSERMPKGKGSVLVKFTVDDWGEDVITEACYDGSGFYGYYVEDLMCDERDVKFIAWRTIDSPKAEKLLKIEYDES